MSEVFAKQLMQISGISPDKAVAILERYPTPRRYCHSPYCVATAEVFTCKGVPSGKHLTNI